MLSLSPRRNRRAHLLILPNGAAFAHLKGARLPDLLFSRLPLRSLSLRPGGLLTALETALSTGFKRLIALALAVQATRLSAFVMVGLLFLLDAPALSGRTIDDG